MSVPEDSIPEGDDFEAAKRLFFEGLSCHQAGDDAGAERHYLASLDKLPGRVSTLVNLAASRLRLGRAGDALSSAQTALAIDANDAQALQHAADALAQLGRHDEALHTLQRLLTLQPNHPIAWSRRGSLLREMNRHAEAAFAFQEALRCGADPELNGFYLASVESTSLQAPPDAPRSYVEGLFDQYATGFNTHLVQDLHYEAHQTLVKLVRSQAHAPFLSALDLGCGTGLCGGLLRPMAQRLVGIDLSLKMLDEARKSGFYDQLEHASLDAWLAGTDERHDLVIAADVFIYVGGLESAFAGVQRVMSRGLFAFSVELADQGGVDALPAASYLLQPSLRYAHSRGYIEALADRHGFRVVATQVGRIREDQRKAIEGLYVVLAKP